MLKLPAQTAIVPVNRGAFRKDLDSLPTPPAEHQHAGEIEVELRRFTAAPFHGASAEGDTFVIRALRHGPEKTAVGQMGRLPTPVLDELAKRPRRHGMEPQSVVLYRAFKDKGPFGGIHFVVSLDLVFDMGLA